jgi:hypothetical protein
VRTASPDQRQRRDIESAAGVSRASVADGGALDGAVKPQLTELTRSWIDPILRLLRGCSSALTILAIRPARSGPIQTLGDSPVSVVD